MIYGYMRETWEFDLHVQKQKHQILVSNMTFHKESNIMSLVISSKNHGESYVLNIVKTLGFKKMFECKFFVHSETLHLQ